MSNQVNARELVTYVDFGGTALWREGLKAKYPEDLRIDGAVEVLKQFEREMTHYEGTPFHHKIAALYESNDNSHEIISEKLRAIGFGYHPESLNHALEDIIGALDNHGFIDRLKKSRIEAEAVDENEGSECGMSWAKDDAEWRDLVAIGKLDPNESGIEELVDALSPSYEWANRSEMLEQMFGAEIEPSDGHARGFIAGALKVKEQVEAAI